MTETRTPSPTPAKAESQLPAKGAAPASATPLDKLRSQINHLFEDFDRSVLHLPFARTPFDSEPFWKRELGRQNLPIVDIAEKDHSFEIAAELPGMDAKDIEVKVVDGMLTIKGEKSQEKEEKKKNYYLSERHYGAFERSFRLPEGIDMDKIDAHFDKGVLKLSLPKLAQARKPEKKIAVSSN
jgi:HSP20 family protein